MLSFCGCSSSKCPRCVKQEVMSCQHVGCRSDFSKIEFTYPCHCSLTYPPGSEMTPPLQKHFMDSFQQLNHICRSSRAQSRSVCAPWLTNESGLVCDQTHMCIHPLSDVAVASHSTPLHHHFPPLRSSSVCRNYELPAASCSTSEELERKTKTEVFLL